MLVRYTVSEFLSAKGSFSRIYVRNAKLQQYAKGLVWSRGGGGGGGALQ